ncbi:unnamed protein product [Linum tenue]|uniref:Peptidase A1 domain-containing protein n=1 Tax=Linum tenue TaxID=586396 RepID=A0AAV0KHL2_9ROSI|nr:unnamed protein product [Linum tenue]
MSCFTVKSNNLFLYGTGQGTIVVLDAGNDLTNPTPCFRDWKPLATVTCPVNAADGSTTIPLACCTRAKQLYYGELQLFGVVIEGRTLRKLHTDLYNSQLLVNREGYQVQYYNSGSSSKALVVGTSKLSKLNDMFGWWEYGVTPPPIKTVWNRYDRINGEVVVDFEKLRRRLVERTQEKWRVESLLVQKEEVVKEKDVLIEGMKREIEGLKARLESGGELEEIRGRLVTKEKQVDYLKTIITALISRNKLFSYFE